MSAIDLFDQLFSPEGFMPHGHCYFWNPFILWLHAVSDGLIALAYLTIPMTLLYIIRRRKDLPFDWMFACFGTFIVACGATHALDIWTIWHPVYWLAGALKAVTAAASLATAVLLVKLVPKILAIPSPAALQRARQALETEISERKHTEHLLEQNAALLRIAGQAARLGGWSLELPDSRLTWSEQTRAIHEVPPDFVPTLEEALAFYTPSSRSEIVRAVERCTREGTAFDCELQIVTARGRLLWVRAVGEAARDIAGMIIGIQGAFQDISARKQAEEIWRETDALARIAGRMTRTGGWTMAVPSGRVFWSDEICHILDYPAGEAPFLGEALERLVEPSRHKVAAAMEACGQDGTPFDLEVETVTAHGRRIWGRICGEADRGPDGSICRIQGAFQDITEHRLTAAETERLHKELIEASRWAGMAEVATNVLHNVGNVLNSVNIAATIAAEKIRQSSHADVARVAKLLREHRDDLPQFLSGARGAKLPIFLEHLAEQLAREQQGALAEFHSLGSHIEHIKKIVSVQQNYARFAGVRERLAPAKLVEDALQIKAAVLERHGIEVIRDFHETPLFEVDKHKVLQILVNLISNARWAMVEPGSAGKRLTLRIRHHDALAAISVMDEGVGIPAENLTRIFEHGFTTREEGHGFGLHSAALAASELGGGLTVQSDGPGRGATFTLALPVNPAPQAANARQELHACPDGKYAVTAGSIESEPA